MARGYTGYKGYGTPEAVERKREIAQALLARTMGTGRVPQTYGEAIGQGMGQIGAALGYRGITKKANEAEREARETSRERSRAAIMGALGAGRAPQARPDPTVARPRQEAPRRTDLTAAMIQQESGGDPNAVSPKGATGLMQVMPETARDPGFGVTPLPQDKLTDPQANERFGTEYMNTMLERYNGDLPRALVAYNWGPGNADQWDGRMESLPEETQGYLRNILPQVQQAQAQPQTMTDAQLARRPQVNTQTLNALAGVLNDPWASPADKQMAASMLEQEMARMRGPEPTSAIREFEYAQDNPAFRQFMQSRRPQTNVNVSTGAKSSQWGDAPKDHVWLRGDQGNVITEPDPSGRGVRPVAVPIAGGPVAEKREQAEEQAEQRGEQQQRYAGVVLEDIGRVRERIENSALPVTGVGSLLQSIPGTPAHDVSKLTDTIRANIGFDRLQQMREASPTGGALGQVSEMENRLLQATLGNLELSQTEEQFLDNLNRLEELYTQIMRKAAAYPNAAEFGFASPPGLDKKEQDIDELLRKYEGG